jgi:hypothetical protein
MAELILTEEEKAAPSYLDWDDAALGKAVKALAIKLHDSEGKESMYGQVAAFMLIGAAHRINADTTTIDLENVTVSDEGIGDWRVEVRRTKAP